MRLETAELFGWLQHLGFWWQAEETCDPAQPPEAVSHKERETEPYRIADVCGGGYSFVSFYTCLPALLCRAYPPKAQWDVLMSPISSARESLCMKFWGTSTCLPACSQCAEVGGSLNKFRRRLPAPTHADVPISLSSREQREGRYFKAIEVENIYSTFCTRTEHWATWVTDRPLTEDCKWLFVANAEIYYLVKAWD